MKALLIVPLLCLVASCTKAQQVFFAVVNNTAAPASTVTVADKTLLTYTATNRYLSFTNNIATPADTVLMFNRNGTNHLNSGRIELRKYAVAAKTTTAATTIITPATNKDYRTGVGGVLNGEKIILFASQYDYVADVFDKNIYILSNNLSGTAWTAPVDLPLPSGMVRYVVYGNLIASDVAGTYYQPCYGFNSGRTESCVWLYKMVYSGGAITSVSIVEIYRGASFLTETTVERLGSGGFIALSRVDGRNMLVQMRSTDGGNTWSAPTDTNMGDGGTYAVNSASDIVADVKLRSDTLICVFQNRVTGWLQVGKKPLSQISTATGWAVTNYYQLNIPGLGYPTMCLLPGSSNVFLLSWGKETNSTNAIIYTRQEDFN